MARMYVIYDNGVVQSLPFDKEVIDNMLGTYWGIPNKRINKVKYGGYMMEMISHQTIMPDDKLNMAASRYFQSVMKDQAVYGPVIILHDCSYS